jgi:hypothetical protein
LERQYRRWIIVATAGIEVLALTDLVLFGTRISHLILVQTPLVFVLAAIRKLLLRGFVLRARELAEPRTDERAGAVYSLKPRRVSDYSNGFFEAVNFAVSVAAVCVIFSIARESQFVPAFLILYVEGGILLWKHALLQRPVALPKEDTEEYLRLAEDAFRMMLRTLDAWRGVMTGFLVLLVIKVKFWNAWMARAQLVGTLLLFTTLAMTMLIIWRQKQKGQALVARAKALQSPMVRRKLADPENLHLGGLVYCNADNPAVAVDGGPLRFAVNVVNRNTYIYLGYWMGLAALLLLIARRM